MKKILGFLKKELMLSVSVVAAIVSLFITPPSADLIKNVDWHTLGTLFMMLCVLEGFKRENIFRPLLLWCTRFKTMCSLSLFLIFGVFFTSMFVTNDVSLIIFVPLTMILFKGAGREKYILPVITLENIAAIRGSLLMPFGSPQNLFFYGRFGISAWDFIIMMAPLAGISALLLFVFVLMLYRKELKESYSADIKHITDDWENRFRIRRISYIALFLMVLAVIVTRTDYWMWAAGIVVAVIFIVNRELFKHVDYVLIITFFCFFIFSESIAASPAISSFLSKAVAGHEYVWILALSQIISNVPSSIVLYPFSANNTALIYGADTAGLISLIGSLASVINYRIYVREYPGKGKAFIKTFTLISWAFFAIVVIPGYLLSRM